MKESKYNYLALKKQAAKLKNELSLLDYFFSLVEKDFLKFEGKVGKEYFFGFLDQRTGSIALNSSSNLWFDHSSGEGGDIIKAVQIYENMNFSQAIYKLSVNTPVELSINTARKKPEATYHIVKEIDIIHPALCQYIVSRGLDLNQVNSYCREIHWNHKDNAYFGIGFKNDNGGWSVRSKLFKGNLLSSGISTIEVGGRVGVIKIFEGMFDFLSYLKLHPEESFIAKVLNSTANFSVKIMREINRDSIDNNFKVDLYLDWDAAGDEKTEKAIEVINAAIDRRGLYYGHSDLNELVVNKVSEEYRRKR